MPDLSLLGRKLWPQKGGEIFVARLPNQESYRTTGRI